ncbi:MAG: carbohydrate ABC transporter permease [Eubacteriales bacterium]|nr:carbohydrate ABC transporter permease [Eubacteriales bacterium]
MKNKRRRMINNIIMFIIAVLVTVVMVVPFLWMLGASFKLRSEIFTVPIQWIPKTFHLDNYYEVLHEINFPVYFWNTAKITISITLLQVLTCSMAAYAFSKLKWPGRDLVFLLYLGTMMIPWHAIMIPQFIIIQRLGLYDNHLSLILTGAFSVFGVFVLRQNMVSIPDSICEAAKIDGCSPFGIYARIILPLTKNGILTLVVLTFNTVWNDYMGPMIYLDSDAKRTIQLGLATFKRQYDANYGAIMAGTVISLIPVVVIYMIAQRYIVDGIAYSGVKG